MTKMTKRECENMMLTVFEEHPEYLEDKEKRASVPWDELIADDKESLGQRKLSSFLCPWK